MPALLYDPNAESNFLRFLFRWRYTFLPMVAGDALFWLLMCVHIMLLYRQRALLDTPA